jgi:four helix bundle protein
MNDFKSLKIWQNAHRLVTQIYKLTGTFPKSEQFGLTSQLQRAAISIVTNIVEGYGRETKKDFNHFLVISRGSLQETRSLLLIAHDLGYISAKSSNKLDDEYLKLKISINAFIKTLK